MVALGVSAYNKKVGGAVVLRRKDGALAADLGSGACMCRLCGRRFVWQWLVDVSVGCSVESRRTLGWLGRAAAWFPPCFFVQQTMQEPPLRASRPPPKARSLTHSSSLAHAHLPCFPAPPACSHQQQKEGEGGETVDDAARRKGRQAKDRAGRAAEDAAEGAKRGWFGLKVGDALGLSPGGDEG